MSPLAQALVINGFVLAAVLEADLGAHRKIGWFRILRPAMIKTGVDTSRRSAHCVGERSLVLTPVTAWRAPD